MWRNRPRLMAAFLMFYVVTDVLLAGLILFGMFRPENSGSGTVWFLLLMGTLALLAGHIGTYYYQNWGRLVHLCLSGLLTLIVVLAILHLMTMTYGCTEHCDEIPVSPGEVVGMAVIILYVAAYLASLRYFTRLKVKEMFNAENS